MFTNLKAGDLKNFSPLTSYKDIYNEKIHSFVSVCLVFVMIGLLFAMRNLTANGCAFAIIVAYFFYLGLTVSDFLKTVLYTFSFSFIYLIMLVLFPAPESFFFGKSLSSILNANEFFYSKEYFIFMRLFLVSSVSVLSLSVINAEVVVLYLAQKKTMPVMLVYPLLFAVNSIHVFKKKFDLYRFNNRLRKIKGLVLPRLLFQFLVFTLRFSESGALSLVARGISENKYYYYDFSLNSRDKRTGASIVFIVMLIVVFA